MWDFVKAHMICPVEVGTLITRDCRSIPQVKNGFYNHSFFHFECISLATREDFNSSNKKWDLPGSQEESSSCLVLPIAQLFKFTSIVNNLNLSDLWADFCHAVRTSGWQKSDNEGLIFCGNRMDFIYMCHRLYRFCVCLYMKIH